MALLPLTPSLLWLTSSRKSLFPFLAHQSPGESKEAIRSLIHPDPLSPGSQRTGLGLGFFLSFLSFYVSGCFVCVCLVPAEARKNVRFPRPEL